ncbi:S8 family serine peptidase [Flavobacterium macrobrachii]|uniref:S8 family serine peptidase n=1 Tax=Flavobacterium macrobrachii TaxID=591204 RepID=A0ABS2CV74_9FLAO|nr:S8 family serine peptidase [Flavobacterium macrobrachii]MBM6498874.1 S8 family serine peptidase [Flavobacterium macrobrachii]
MKKIVLLFIFLLSQNIFSQEDAWVYFTDKPDSQYYFDNPLEMLSQRALDRRTNQGIALDILDVPIHQLYFDQISTSSGIEVKSKSKWMNAVHVRGSISAIDALADLTFVSNIQFANRSLNTQNRIANNSENKAVNKQLDVQENFVYGNSSNQIQMLNGHLLHQQDYTGTGKIIAVMDAGFPNVNTASSFQRIRDNNQILGGYNFVARNENVYTSNSHGTLVLSLMAGYVENQLVGTAPDANYYLFITEDSADENPVEESYWVEAAELADSLGVDVINTSLGYFAYNNPSYSYTYADMNGVTSFISRGADIAFSRGMICVTSAGNSGNSANPNISTPADAIHTLTVGSVKFDETYSTFSSIGPTFDGRIKPDVMAQGQNPYFSTTSGSVSNASSGTSFSGPIIAGMVASFWQAIPWATNQQVVDFVLQSADRFTNPTTQFGYGIPDFQVALNMAQLSVEENEKIQFLVYPNPVKDKVIVSFSNDLPGVKLLIFNSLRQQIMEKTITQNDNLVATSELQNGIYFYKVLAKNTIQTGKIIKN